MSEAMDWDSDLGEQEAAEQQKKNEFELLPDGDYDFEIKKLEKDAYTATKDGKDFPDDPNWTTEQKNAVKAGKKKAKDEIAAAKKAEREAKAAAKAKAASAQMDLFGFNV